jgi:hypothetical protein
MRAPGAERPRGASLTRPTAAHGLPVRGAYLAERLVGAASIWMRLEGAEPMGAADLELGRACACAEHVPDRPRPRRLLRRRSLACEAPPLAIVERGPPAQRAEERTRPARVDLRERAARLVRGREAAARSIGPASHRAYEPSGLRKGVAVGGPVHHAAHTKRPLRARDRHHRAIEARLRARRVVRCIRERTPRCSRMVASGHTGVACCPGRRVPRRPRACFPKGIPPGSFPRPRAPRIAGPISGLLQETGRETPRSTRAPVGLLGTSLAHSTPCARARGR